MKNLKIKKIINLSFTPKELEIINSEIEECNQKLISKLKRLGYSDEQISNSGILKIGKL